jgi:hypothetical protein
MPTYANITFTGNSNVTLTRAGLAFDGSSGQVWEEMWEGTAAGIATKYAEVIALGGKARRGSEGGNFTLSVTYARDPDDVSTEVPTEEWEADTETAEVDLFALAPVVKEAGRYTSVSLYRKEITDAVNDGEAFPLSVTDYPVGNYIFSLLARGVTSQPLSKPVLSRSRTFSAYYTGRNRASAVQTVWTTDALITAFSIPASVQATLPETPSADDTPAGTVWGWKLTVDRGQFNVATGRWNENKTWVFSAWVQGLFNFVT